MSAFVKGDLLVVVAVTQTKHAMGFRPGDTCNFVRDNPKDPKFVQVRFADWDNPIFFEVEDVRLA